jgi:hypothetical protein
VGIALLERRRYQYVPATKVLIIGQRQRDGVFAQNLREETNCWRGTALAQIIQIEHEGAKELSAGCARNRRRKSVHLADSSFHGWIFKA